jgi:hypothetical protein
MVGIPRFSASEILDAGALRIRHGRFMLLIYVRNLAILNAEHSCLRNVTCVSLVVDLITGHGARGSLIEY